MLPALTADAMRAADNQTIESFGIPGFTLMETAGRAVARAVIDELTTTGRDEQQRVVCLCGTGNNGADGLVVARVLYDGGIPVSVIIVGSPKRLGEDGSRHYKLLKMLQAVGENDDASLRIIVTDDPPTLATSLPTNAALIVDALLGTGMRGAAREPYASWIRAANSHPARIVSVDVPSGLNADSGVVDGEGTRASRTVTFGALKIGLLLNAGPISAGRIEVAAIGIPGFILREQTSRSGCAMRITRSDISIPVRGENAHKYSAGVVGALCGSRGLTGAAVMSTTAAMRVGAGAVTCAAGEFAVRVLAAKLTEVMTVELPEDARGLQPEAAPAAFISATNKATALLVGCGAGRGVGTVTTIGQIVRTTTQPLVLDADGLFALGSNPVDYLRDRDGPVVLTPHRGEFERLVGGPADWHGRVELARRYASEWNCVLVLKGLPTIVGSPEGHAYVAPSNSTALATAGSGDVLAGMIAGFLSQNLKPEAAALAALYVGGLCAERFEQRRAPQSMMATDLIAEIPTALAALRHA